MKKAILIFLVMFSVSQIYIQGFLVKAYERESGSSPDLFYIPDSRYIKPLVLSYAELAADIIFIKTISYFADQLTGKRDYRYLEKLLYITAGLDPMFEKVYLWGGSILLYNGKWITRDRVLTSSKFLEYGWNNIKGGEIAYRHDPEYWRIPQMIGFNYAIELHEPAKGVPYIEEVARIPGAPSFYKTWASTLLKKSGETGKALKNLERELIVENLRTTLSQNIDRELKDLIVERLRKYYREFYDETSAREKVEELVAETRQIQMLYQSNFPYLPLELFFALNADKVLKSGRDNIVDRLSYDLNY